MSDDIVTAANTVAIEAETFSNRFAWADYADVGREDATEVLERLTAALLGLEAVRKRLHRQLDEAR